jgi:hypothetical protein
MPSLGNIMKTDNKQGISYNIIKNLAWLDFLLHVV